MKTLRKNTVLHKCLRIFFFSLKGVYLKALSQGKEDLVINDMQDLLGIHKFNLYPTAEWHFWNIFPVTFRAKQFTKMLRSECIDTNKAVASWS